jgi:glyceraldehyde 3-phosphate dehydrogenase
MTHAPVHFHRTNPVRQRTNKHMSKGGRRAAVRVHASVSPENTDQKFTLDQIRELAGDDIANTLLEAASATGEPRDVVLYGFGRIGRLMARILLSTPTNLRVKAVVQRPVKDQKGALTKRAELLLRDSVHGMFPGSIDIDEDNESLVVNGNSVRFITSSDPDTIDYTEYGIENALVIDNTGVWRDAEGLARHLQAKGASQVILTAPGKGMKNIVANVNSVDIEGTDTIISAASCTTNAVAPPLKVIDEAFGVVSGHLETVHSFTNDQNLIDNYHKADRRGRAAPLNMVISETGAGKAVSKALPNLDGKLTSNAIRVPTPDVSMAILVLQLGKETTADELNAAFKAASEGDLKDTLGYSVSREAVSQDFIGSKNAGVIDAPATMCKGSACTVYIWYDNENGYSNQVVRVMETLNTLTCAACDAAAAKEAEEKK